MTNVLQIKNYTLMESYGFFLIQPEKLGMYMSDACSLVFQQIVITAKYLMKIILIFHFHFGSDFSSYVEVDYLVYRWSH